MNPRRRLSLSRPLQRGLRRTTESAPVPGNAARLLVDGPMAYPVMLDRIAGARHHVHFENYIIRDDEVGRRFADAFADRARAGVEVRVLYDWIGSLRTAGSFWDHLREAGCEIRSFGPFSLRRPFSLFRRNHRKLLVVDDRVAVVGGLCIGNEWIGDDGTDCWRDTAIEFEGPIARALDRTFRAMWLRAGGRGPPALGATSAGSDPAAERGSESGGYGNVVARVVDGPPAHARAYRVYQLIAALAERTLYLTGAYPLVPTSLRSALAAAARAGVDVRLLAPGRSDLPLVNQAARAHYASLLRAGIRIYEWTGPMLHAKTVVADGAIALIGSSNLNPFSLFGTFELDVEIEERALARALERQFFRDLGSAREITLADWRRRRPAQRWKERIGAALLWLPYKLFTS